MTKISTKEYVYHLQRMHPEMDVNDIEWFVEALADWNMLNTKGDELYREINHQIYGGYEYDEGGSKWIEENGKEIKVQVNLLLVLAMILGSILTAIIYLIIQKI